MYVYRWTIEKIDGYPQLNGLESVVSEVWWEVEVRDTDDHSIHYLRKSTKLNLENLDSSSFTDHLELSDEQVLQWVWNIIGKEATELQAKQELDDLRSPPANRVAQLSMPWKGSCCPDGTGMPEAQPGAQ